MEHKNLQFLTRTADILVKELDAFDLVKELKILLDEYFSLKDLNIYVFDPNTSTLRNYAQNWCVIDDIMKDEVKQPIYNAYNDIHGNDFVINNKAFKLPQTISEISFKIDSLYMPIVKNGMVFGIIELLFKDGVAPEPLHTLMEDIFQSIKKRKSMTSEEEICIWNNEFRDKTKELRKALAKYTGVF